jgi:hypothetical protein
MSTGLPGEIRALAVGNQEYGFHFFVAENSC